MRFWSLIALAGCGGTASGEEGKPQQVYFHVDDITLTRGAEDATSDTSGAITATLTPYLDGSIDRDTRIAAVLASMQEIVAPFRIDIVTTRPDLSRYDMIVIAGTYQEAGFAVETGGVAAVDCLNTIPNKVVVVFGNSFPASLTPVMMASQAIAGLGFSQGLSSSDVPNDCLCWAGANCAFTAQCTFGGAGTPIAANDECADGETTMDPAAEFASVYPLAQ